MLRFISLFLFLLMSVPAMAGASQQYLLDDANGTAFALYAGSAYRSAVDPADAVASLDALEKRAAALPAGASIGWNPARRDAASRPLLFGSAEDADKFAAFCAAHNISLSVAPPVCKAPDDCAAYCKGAGAGKECEPDGVPACNDGRCTCFLTCL